MNWGTNEKGTNEMGDQWDGGPMSRGDQWDGGTNEMGGAWVLIGGPMRWGTYEMGDQWYGGPMRWGTNDVHPGLHLNPCGSVQCMRATGEYSCATKYV